jgi:hypothetical protein
MFVIDSTRLGDDPVYVQVMTPEVHVVMFLMALMKKLGVDEGTAEALVDVMACEELDEGEVDVAECEDVAVDIVLGRETGPTAATRPAHRARVK